MIEKVTSKLLNDRYKISNSLDFIIGKGSVVSFRKDNSWRTANIEDDILVLDLTEEDAYTGVIQNLEDIKNKIQDGKTDLNISKLLSRRYCLEYKQNNIKHEEDIENINNTTLIEQK
jgi:DNA phosphorothioation-dependent restriction protein DptH